MKINHLFSDLSSIIFITSSKIKFNASFISSIDGNLSNKTSKLSN